MLADMNRLPSIPSRPAPPQPYASFAPFQRPTAAIVPPSQHHRPRDPDGAQSHAQQLPSLRTLLEPQLLDTKLPDPPPPSGGVPLAHGTALRYGSQSPTLKRRHDFDGYSHEPSESNAIAGRAPPSVHHRHAQYPAATDAPPAAFMTPGSTHGPRPPDFSRQGSLARPPHGESVGKLYRPQSTPVAGTASSDPLGSLVGQPPHDDPMDIVKPVRRRTEGSSRTQTRTTRCIGQREIPGEGLCYIYEDGTFCRAVIDGEPVNPSWGITKAGKPRKRLAQACLTCREKKIKCEPGYPKCHQCAKSQRQCRG